MKVSATKKQKINRILLVAFICMVTLLTVALLINLGGAAATRGQANRLEAEIQRLEAERVAAEAELAYRQTDDFVRDYARENLGMQNEGDQVFVIN